MKFEGDDPSGCRESRPSAVLIVILITAPLWLTVPVEFFVTEVLDSSNSLLVPASFLIPAIGFVGLCRIGFGTFELFLATVYYLPVAWILTALISWISS